jgi:TrpR family trp operon transcriptional repressor
MKNIKAIAQVLSKINDQKLIEEFLLSILTKRELEDLSSRWELVKLLDKGISQRKIAKDLHLSLCKITRGSKELKKENSALKRIIKEINS